MRLGCFLCGRSFSRRKMLDDHLMRHYIQIPVWDQALPGARAAGSVSLRNCCGSILLEKHLLGSDLAPVFSPFSFAFRQYQIGVPFNQLCRGHELPFICALHRLTTFQDDSYPESSS
jgi:hypothetical protein